MADATPQPSAVNGADHGPDGKFIVGNQAARVHGLRAAYQPPDVRMNAAEFEAGLVSDLGGVEALSTLERAYVKRLIDVDIALRLLVSHLAVHGLTTPGGRVREHYDKLLAGCLAFDRLAQRLGLQRRQRPVASIEQLMRGAADV